MAFDLIKWPMGDASVIVPDYTADVEVRNDMTFVQPAIIAADKTLNLAIASGVKPGAILHFKQKATNNGDDITFGTGFASPPLVGVAGKTKVITFIYDGAYYYPLAPSLQID